ncbi:hypothetical protein ACLOJK_030542 [Asimina triloba]
MKLIVLDCDSAIRDAYELPLKAPSIKSDCSACGSVRRANTEGVESTRGIFGKYSQLYSKREKRESTKIDGRIACTSKDNLWIGQRVRGGVETTVSFAVTHLGAMTSILK